MVLDTEEEIHCHDLSFLVVNLHGLDFMDTQMYSPPPPPSSITTVQGRVQNIMTPQYLPAHPTPSHYIMAYSCKVLNSEVIGYVHVTYKL